ncbi:tetraspanin-3-like [Phalacrocorax carbo]|uniref:tetraspanin-3-like n=1 Tax=Phalacrocorax carbo TaxID=9209 RepID=UPI0031194A5C
MRARAFLASSSSSDDLSSSSLLLRLSSPSWRCKGFWVGPFARHLLRILGVILWGVAIALAAGGVFVILLYKNYRYLFQESSLSLSGWLAVAAALTSLLTGFLAISVSANSSRCQRGALMYLLLMLLCLEMSLAVLAKVYSIRMASELKSTMGNLVYQYNGTHSQGPGSRDLDVLQRNLQCCGVQNYTDWLKATAASRHLPGEEARVPESCCKEKYSHCRGDLGHREQLFQEGCLKKLEHLLHFVMLYIFWCCIALSVLELFACISNGILMKYQPFHDFQILD